MKRQKLLGVLKQLLKNAKKSDREVAKLIGVSQPTVTRVRIELEKEGYIRTYTAVPDLAKLDYQILAFTLTSLKTLPSKEEVKEIIRKATEWAGKRANIIFAADGSGLRKNIVMVSLHRDYAKYTDFMREYTLEWGNIIGETESFLVSLGSSFMMKPLDLKYLADDL